MKKQVNWGAVHRVRLGHVNKLLIDRYGFEMPDDDAGTEDLRILLHVKANAYRPERREKALFNEIGLRAPWMPAEKARQTAAEIALNPLKITSGWLGQALCVDSTTRDRLAIWQIGATDLDAEAAKKRRRERRRQRDRERKRRVRQPRAEYLADVKRNSERTTKPWLAMGISRATYYRHQSKGGETRSVRKTNGKMRPRPSAQVPSIHEGDAPGLTSTERQRGCGPKKGEDHLEARYDQVRAGKADAHGLMFRQTNGHTQCHGRL